MVVVGRPHYLYLNTRSPAEQTASSLASQLALPDLSNLHLAPAIFQQCIDAEFDVRVTVVGRKTFPAIIHHSNVEESNVRDWRIGHLDGNLQIGVYENFPADIAELCVQHVNKLGLVYGALDFVMDKKGVLWFLENNPGGQWGFVERLTEQPIGKAIAEMLHAGNSR